MARLYDQSVSCILYLNEFVRLLRDYQCPSVRVDQNFPDFSMLMYADDIAHCNDTVIGTGLTQTWEIGRFSIKTRRYVGKREEKITTEYELVNLLCFINEFPKTKRRKYPQYASE